MGSIDWLQVVTYVSSLACLSYAAYVNSKGERVRPIILVICSVALAVLAFGL